MTKLLTTPALRVCHEDNDALVASPRDDEGPAYTWWFCISAIRNIFDLPDVRKVWLEFHDTPGVNRCYVEVIERETRNNDMIVTVDGTRLVVAGFTGRMIASRLGRTSCYVECKFEERSA